MCLYVCVCVTVPSPSSSTTYRYSFGGSKHPYSESVSLIESITHSQISAMVKLHISKFDFQRLFLQIRKATDVSRWRGKRSMSIDDILFLLRKNKVMGRDLCIISSCKCPSLSRINFELC